MLRERYIITLPVIFRTRRVSWYTFSICSTSSNDEKILSGWIYASHRYSGLLSLNRAIKNGRKRRGARYVSASKRSYSSAAYSLSFIDVLAPLLFPVEGNRRNCTWTMIDIEGLRGTYRCGLEANETWSDTRDHVGDKNVSCITTMTTRLQTRGACNKCAVNEPVLTYSSGADWNWSIKIRARPRTIKWVIRAAGSLKPSNPLMDYPLLSVSSLW